MDNLDFIFLFIGIMGGILYAVCVGIIKIDDIMTDKKIERYFNSIGVSGSKKWNHPVYNRLLDDHYIFTASMDKTKFFFYLCEVIGLQLTVLKSYFLPMNSDLLVIGLGFEAMLIMIAVPHFMLFYNSYEVNWEYHKKLRKKKR